MLAGRSLYSYLATPAVIETLFCCRQSRTVCHLGIDFSFSGIWMNSEVNLYIEAVKLVCYEVAFCRTSLNYNEFVPFLVAVALAH